MTASAATIKEIREQFEDVLKNGGDDIDAVDGELYGGTASAKTLFRSVATRAGRAVGGPGDGDGFEIWVDLLRTRTELCEEGFIEAVQSVRPEYLNISLSQIDPPPKKNDLPKRTPSAGTAAVIQRVREALKADSGLASKVDPDLLNLTSTRRRRLEKRIRAAILLQMMHYVDETHMSVFEGSQGRYTVESEHRAIYEAYVALGHSTARCAVQPTGDKWDERRHIRRTCQASITLCKLLEAEVFDDDVVTASASDGVDYSVTKAKPRPVKKETLTVKEAATLMSCSERTIRRWSKTGHITAITVGPRLIRIPATEIQRLRSQRQS